MYYDVDRGRGERKCGREEEEKAGVGKIVEVEVVHDYLVSMGDMRDMGVGEIVGIRYESQV